MVRGKIHENKSVLKENCDCISSGWFNNAMHDVIFQGSWQVMPVLGIRCA